MNTTAVKPQVMSRNALVLSRLRDDPEFRSLGVKKLNLQSLRFGGKKWKASNLTAEFQALDKEFGLMAITEQFDESSVLLSQDLCWPLKDFAAMNKKVRLEEYKVHTLP